MIRAGEIDVAVCGGAEACIDTVSLGGFAAARALSTGYNDRPSAASRPFDRGRDGFVMGEGAGVVVIEALEHALLRGAEPLAELVGYGTTADAHHRSEEHTSELQSLMRISYAVFCLKKKKRHDKNANHNNQQM